MACGAPVVASGNSSLRELVDAGGHLRPPRRATPWPHAIERGLVDEAYRRPAAPLVGPPAAHLVRGGRAGRRGLPAPEHRARWHAAARHRPRGAAARAWPWSRPGPRPPPAWPRTRADWPGPWPTSSTSTCSSTATRPTRPSADPGFPSYPARALPRVDPVQGGYDAVVACVGNSEHHAGALALVRLDRVPAAVLAHDVRLNGLYRHGAARGAVPEGNAAVVTRLYEEATEDWITDGWLQPAEAEEHGVYLARELIGLADPFIVTSEYAAEAGPPRRPARGPGPRRGLPVRLSAAGAASGRPGATGTGLPPSDWSTRSSSPSCWWPPSPSSTASDPATRLAFVGPIDPALRERYHALAVRPRGRRCGDLHRRRSTTTSTRRGWPGRRWPCSSGPAPTGRPRAAVADCLSHGVATVVTDAGPGPRSCPTLVAKVPVDADAGRAGRGGGRAPGRSRASVRAPGRRGPGLRGRHGLRPGGPRPPRRAGSDPVPARPGRTRREPLGGGGLPAGRRLARALPGLGAWTRPTSWWWWTTARPGPRCPTWAAGSGPPCVRSRDNQGIRRRGQPGIRPATGDVVALLNDDAVADADLAGRLPRRHLLGPVGGRRHPQGPARRMVRPVAPGTRRPGSPRRTPGRSGRQAHLGAPRRRRAARPAGGAGHPPAGVRRGRRQPRLGGGGPGRASRTSSPSPGPSRGRRSRVERRARRWR